MFVYFIYNSAELLIAEKSKLVSQTPYYNISSDDKDSKLVKGDAYVEPSLSINELPLEDISASRKDIRQANGPLTVWRNGTRRVALPFISSHDIPRGVIHALQAALSFTFMLAVMTFQVGFILSICVGLGVGEIMFGRYAEHRHLY